MTEKKISKKDTFAYLLKKHPQVAEVLFEKGMHCIGCPMAMQETLEQGAIAHGINADNLIKEINRELNKEQEKDSEKNAKKNKKTSKRKKKK